MKKKKKKSLLGLIIIKKKNDGKWLQEIDCQWLDQVGNFLLLRSKIFYQGLTIEGVKKDQSYKRQEFSKKYVRFFNDLSSSLYLKFFLISKIYSFLISNQVHQNQLSHKFVSYLIDLCNTEIKIQKHHLIAIQI